VPRHPHRTPPRCARPRAASLRGRGTERSACQLLGGACAPARALEVFGGHGDPPPLGKNTACPSCHSECSTSAMRFSVLGNSLRERAVSNRSATCYSHLSDGRRRHSRPISRRSINCSELVPHRLLACRVMPPAQKHEAGRIGIGAGLRINRTQSLGGKFASIGADSFRIAPPNARHNSPVANPSWAAANRRYAAPARLRSRRLDIAGQPHYLVGTS
jgi:hypothetical protein